jgi:chromate transport protein ChrA
MHMRERFNEIPGTARQLFFNQSLVRFPQILISTDIGEAQALHGAIAAAVAVMVITGITIIRPHWQSATWPKLLLFVCGSFLLSAFYSVPPIRVLLAAACVGYFWPVKAIKV